MKAKFESTCNACGGVIEKGTEIAKTSGAYGWEHANAADCEAAAEAASEAHYFDQLSRRDEIMGFHDNGYEDVLDAEEARLGI